MNPVIALATSRLGPFIGIMLGRMVPPKVTAWLADQLAALAASVPKNQIVRAVRANQAVVRGMDVYSPDLSEVVIEVFKNAGRGYMTFFHGLARGRSALADACSIDPDFATHVKTAQEQGKGVFIVGPHMGNFDISLVALHEVGIHPLVLSYRTPRGSYVADNAIRRSYGVELTPISAKSLKRAMKRLRQGGVVLTLVDRPDSQGEVLRFFGKPARLPTGHVRMAIRTGAVLQVGVSLKESPRHYRIEGPPPIPAHVLDSETEDQAVKRLAGAVIQGMETYIARRPSEWLMYFPVWPQALPR